MRGLLFDVPTFEDFGEVTNDVLELVVAKDKLAASVDLGRKVVTRPPPNTAARTPVPRSTFVPFRGSASALETPSYRAFFDHDGLHVRAGTNSEARLSMVPYGRRLVRAGSDLVVVTLGSREIQRVTHSKGAVSLEGAPPLPQPAHFVPWGGSFVISSANTIMAPFIDAELPAHEAAFEAENDVLVARAPASSTVVRLREGMLEGVRIGGDLTLRGRWVLGRDGAQLVAMAIDDLPFSKDATCVDVTLTAQAAVERKGLDKTPASFMEMIGSAYARFNHPKHGEVLVFQPRRIPEKGERVLLVDVKAKRAKDFVEVGRSSAERSWPAPVHTASSQASSKSEKASTGVNAKLVGAWRETFAEWDRAMPRRFELALEHASLVEPLLHLEFPKPLGTAASRRQAGGAHEPGCIRFCEELAFHMLEGAAEPLVARTPSSDGVFLDPDDAIDAVAFDETWARILASAASNPEEALIEDTLLARVPELAPASSAIIKKKKSEKRKPLRNVALVAADLDNREGAPLQRAISDALSILRAAKEYAGPLVEALSKPLAGAYRKIGKTRVAAEIDDWQITPKKAVAKTRLGDAEIAAKFGVEPGPLLLGLAHLAQDIAPKDPVDAFRELDLFLCLEFLDRRVKDVRDSPGICTPPEMLEFAGDSYDRYGFYLEPGDRRPLDERIVCGTFMKDEAEFVAWNLQVFLCRQVRDGVKAGCGLAAVLCLLQGVSEAVPERRKPKKLVFSAPPSRL